MSLDDFADAEVDHTVSRPDDNGGIDLIERWDKEGIRVENKLMREYLEFKFGNVSDRRLTSTKSALKKLNEYICEKSIDIKDVNIDKFYKFVLKDYTEATATTYRNDVASFLKFVNDRNHLEDNKLKGDKETREEQVVDVVYQWLNGMYPDDVIKKEHTIAGGRIKGYTSTIPDIVVDESKVAVECKGSTPHSIMSGVGQSIFYEYYGYKPVIATGVYWDNLANVCKERGIWLMYVDTSTNSIDGLVEPQPV